MIVTRFKHWRWEGCHSWWERSIHSQFTSRLLEITRDYWRLLAEQDVFYTPLEFVLENQWYQNHQLLLSNDTFFYCLDFEFDGFSKEKVDLCGWNLEVTTATQRSWL